jgi:hypothetical protein
MPSESAPKQILYYQPIGRRYIKAKKKMASYSGQNGLTRSSIADDDDDDAFDNDEDYCIWMAVGFTQSHIWDKRVVSFLLQNIIFF